MLSAQSKWACPDCGWKGDEPDEDVDYALGWDTPCTLRTCPECGEAVYEPATDERASS